MGAAVHEGAVRILADAAGVPLGVVIRDPVPHVRKLREESLRDVVVHGVPPQLAEDVNPSPVVREEVRHPPVVGLGEGDGFAEVVLEAVGPGADLGQGVPVFAVIRDKALLIFALLVFPAQLVEVVLRLYGLPRLRLLRLPFGASREKQDGTQRGESEKDRSSLPLHRIFPLSLLNTPQF